jgi:hypothetical protein
MANLEMLLGQMTQGTRMGRGMRHGANHAARNLRPAGIERAADPVRPLKKRGGCKTCDGTGCVGRCRF